MRSSGDARLRARRRARARGNEDDGGAGAAAEGTRARREETFFLGWKPVLPRALPPPPCFRSRVCAYPREQRVDAQNDVRFPARSAASPALSGVPRACSEENKAKLTPARALLPFSDPTTILKRPHTLVVSPPLSVLFVLVAGPHHAFEPHRVRGRNMHLDPTRVRGRNMHPGIWAATCIRTTPRPGSHHAGYVIVPGHALDPFVVGCARGRERMHTY